MIWEPFAVYILEPFAVAIVIVGLSTDPNIVGFLLSLDVPYIKVNIYKQTNKTQSSCEWKQYNNVSHTKCNRKSCDNARVFCDSEES